MGRRCGKDKLLVRWSKQENDIEIFYPDSCDGHLVHYYLGSKIPTTTFGEFDPSFFDELKKRGYDLTTFRMEIKKKE